MTALVRVALLAIESFPDRDHASQGSGPCVMLVGVRGGLADGGPGGLFGSPRFAWSKQHVTARYTNQTSAGELIPQVFSGPGQSLTVVAVEWPIQPRGIDGLLSADQAGLDHLCFVHSELTSRPERGNIPPCLAAPRFGPGPSGCFDLSAKST